MKNTPRSLSLSEHGWCSCQEQEVCPGKPESGGRGCGWANERQKEGMLIMYSCWGSVCRSVFVCGDGLRKDGGEKPSVSRVMTCFAVCDLQINCFVWDGNTRNRVNMRTGVISGIQKHRPCLFLLLKQAVQQHIPQQRTDAITLCFFPLHFCVISAQAPPYSYQILWDELFSNMRETTSNKMIHLCWAYFWLLSFFVLHNGCWNARPFHQQIFWQLTSIHKCK